MTARRKGIATPLESGLVTDLNGNVLEFERMQDAQIKAAELNRESIHNDIYYRAVPSIEVKGSYNVLHIKWLEPTKGV